MYLYKLLAKIKAAVESPRLPPEVRKPQTLSTEAAVLNVHARLCKSNPVKEALPVVLADIGSAMGVKLKEDGGPGKKRLRAKDYDASATENAGSRESKPTQHQESISVSEGSDDDGDGGGVSLGDDVSDDELERFNNRLASSDGEDASDDEDDDLDVEAIERKLEQEGIARKASKSSKAPRPEYDPQADMELSEDDEPSASPPPEPRKAPALKKSAFVPSLSMGGYISGSGSDIEDINEAPRKNRRGQRARQQIWEKKYGAKAQHLQKEAGKQGRDAGWDPKRGATDGTERREKSKPFDRSARTKPTRKEGMEVKPAAGEVKPAPKHRDDSGALHPSWAAAKLAKEKKAAAPVVFQGKKISFD